MDDRQNKDVLEYLERIACALEELKEVLKK